MLPNDSPATEPKRSNNFKMSNTSPPNSQSNSFQNKPLNVTDETLPEPKPTPQIPKTVTRIVKKIVKKKVIKRVPKNPQLPHNHKHSTPPNPNSCLPLEKEVENPNSRIPSGKEVESPNFNLLYPKEFESPNPDLPSEKEFKNPNHGINFANEVFDPVVQNSDEKCKSAVSCSVASNVETEIPSPNIALPLKIENSRKDSEHPNADLTGELAEDFHDDSGGKRFFVSEEMEALERKKRRRTQIFIGGLDRDANEEDIRKVFEQAGEVVDVTLLMKSGQTSQNKGYAFLRYASAADAKKALEVYSKVKICGKEAITSAVEGNDTLFLGNIDKKWKNKDVLKLLQDIGIEKIDAVTVMPHPTNVDYNRGFAFLELETSKDAKNAFNKLQKQNVFGKHINIAVAWAEPLTEPDEEEMLKVKSVYVECVPTTWDEGKVRNFFKRFGKIDSIVLSQYLPSSKRKDFAFVHFNAREAAISCIESFGHELLDSEGTKVNMKVSIANPPHKGKKNKRPSNSISKETSTNKLVAATKHVRKSTDTRNMGKFPISNRSGYQFAKVDRDSSTNDELLQLLREQASMGQSKQARLGSDTGLVNVNYPLSLPGMKRPFSIPGNHMVYSDRREYQRTHVESLYPTLGSSYNSLSNGVGMTSHPYYQHRSSDYGSGYSAADYPSKFQRAGAPQRDVYRI